MKTATKTRQNNRLNKQIKQSLCTCALHLVHFFAVLYRTAAWNGQNFRFFREHERMTANLIFFILTLTHFTVIYAPNSWPAFSMLYKFELYNCGRVTKTRSYILNWRFRCRCRRRRRCLNTKTVEEERPPHESGKHNKKNAPEIRFIYCSSLVFDMYDMYDNRLFSLANQYVRCELHRIFTSPSCDHLLVIHTTTLRWTHCVAVKREEDRKRWMEQNSTQSH